VFNCQILRIQCIDLQQFVEISIRTNFLNVVLTFVGHAIVTGF